MVKSFTEQNAHSYPEMIKEILEALSGHNLVESSNEQNSPTYIEELSNDTSHASNEMVKQMVEVWTAIVGERSPSQEALI